VSFKQLGGEPPTFLLSSSRPSPLSLDDFQIFLGPNCTFMRTPKRSRLSVLSFESCGKKDVFPSRSTTRTSSSSTAVPFRRGKSNPSTTRYTPDLSSTFNGISSPILRSTSSSVDAPEEPTLQLPPTPLVRLLSLFPPSKIASNADSTSSLFLPFRLLSLTQDLVRRALLLSLLPRISPFFPFRSKSAS